MVQLDAIQKRLIEEIADLARPFLSIGNHEWCSASWPEFRRQTAALGARWLEDSWTDFRGVALGGLSSRPAGEAVDTSFLAELSAQPGFRLLLCHHPEWYRPYVKPYDLDLTLSGHAHGGQICLLGLPLYAPNQGLFPRLVHGYYEDGKLLVSRGMTNSVNLPRVGNPCELILLRLEPGEQVSRWIAPPTREEAEA